MFCNEYKDIYPLYTTVSISLFSPLAYRDPLHCNMNRLFVMLLKDSLTEYAYDAELAGLNYHVDVSIYGIIVSKCTSHRNCI